jgi:hypothetical protein
MAEGKTNVVAIRRRVGSMSDAEYSRRMHAIFDRCATPERSGVGRFGPRSRNGPETDKGPLVGVGDRTLGAEDLGLEARQSLRIR